MPATRRGSQSGHSISQTKQARMLTAAVDVFLAHGYHASMDRIAAKANVAKQTVYNHFGSKEQLFAVVVSRMAEAVAVPLAETERDVRSALIEFALELRKRVVSPKGIAAHRALVSEAPRFPKLAKLIYRTGPQAAQQALADYLARQIDDGALQIDDCDFAAQMFFGMLNGQDRVRALYGIKADRSKSAELRHAQRVVDCFLNAFSNSTTSTQGNNGRKP